MSAEEIWSLFTSDQLSPLTSSFWAGRYLQLVEEVDCSSSCVLLAKDMLTIKTTSLSPAVHKMVVDNIAKFTRKDDVLSLLSPDGTLDWSAVTDFIDQGVRVGDKDYNIGGERCAELAFLVHYHLTTSKAIQTQLEKRERYEWTNSPELFTSLVTGIGSECPLLTLLLSTAALERALGDVYMSVSKRSRCPPLLRDLLASVEMEETLGATVVFVLSCIIGPPSGLNLRNIAWHGFLSPSELPVEYISLFLLLVASIGPLLTLPPSVRPYHTLTCDTHLATVFKDLESRDGPLLEELVTHSFFILPTMLSVWRSAINAFNRERYSVVLVSLLPALEHSLRRVFAVTNNCPHRALTAESTTLYTTFDEILSPVLPSGEKNKFASEIGASKMEMLLDVLVYTEGPRIRDRISHSEVEFDQLSKVLANHILCLSMLFCTQYCLNKDLLKTPLVQSWFSREASYISLFHPLSLLKQELLCILTSLTEWESISKPADVSLDPTPLSWPTRAALLTALCQVRPEKHLDNWCGGVEDVRGVIECVWGQGMITLYMEGRSLELVGVARRMVGNARETISLIQETASLRYSQYINKQLRSRQRPNYLHLLSSLTGYSEAMLLLVVLSLNCLSHLPLDKQSLRILKYHKKLLQFSENTLSQSTKHRWMEVDQLCTSLTLLAANLPVETNQSS